MAARLIKATEKFRGGRLRALIESKHELPQGITEEAVREQLDIAGSIGAANVNIIELAEKAGLSYEYKTIYSILCDIAHVSPMGLAHYLIDDPVARKLRVNPNGSLLDPEYLIVLASATQLNILTLAAQILKDTHPPEYEELRSANGAKIQKFHQKMFE